MIATLAQMLAQLRTTRDTSPVEIYAIGTRLAGAGIFFVGGILMLVLLDPVQIGVLLALTSLSGFSLIADLGLTYSFLLAVSSREPEDAGHLAWAAFATSVPTTLATGTILFLVGSAFLLQADVGSAHWLWPWMAYCAVSSLQLVLTLALTYAEGTGRRHAAWKAHFWLEIAGGAAFVAAIGLGWELWAIALNSLVRVLFILVLFARRFRLPPRSPGGSKFMLWRHELWPMQWKTLVNNLVGVATTRLLTPLVLAGQGSVAAGQIGMILAMAFLATTAASVWPLSQTAVYAGLYREGRGQELKAMFRRTFTASLSLAVLFVISGGLACEMLKAYSPHMAARLPASWPLWIILAAVPIGHLTNCFAMAVRAQRRDPVVVPNMLLAVPALAALSFAADRGVLTFSLAYLAMAAAFLLLYAYFFVRLLRRINASPQEAQLVVGDY